MINRDNIILNGFDLNKFEKLCKKYLKDHSYCLDDIDKLSEINTKNIVNLFLLPESKISGVYSLQSGELLVNPKSFDNKYYLIPDIGEGTKQKSSIFDYDFKIIKARKLNQTNFNTDWYGTSDYALVIVGSVVSVTINKDESVKVDLKTNSHESIVRYGNAELILEVKKEEYDKYFNMVEF